MNALFRTHFTVIAPDHRIVTYDWQDAVAEWAALIGGGIPARVVQTHRNFVQCDVTDEARADWCGDEDEMERMAAE